MSNTPLREAMMRLHEAIMEIPPKANDYRLLNAYDAVLNALPSEKGPITPDALECLRRLIAKHTGEQLPSITPERVIEIVRAGMRAVKV
jgi:hypothetical protein